MNTQNDLAAAILSAENAGYSVRHSAGVVTLYRQNGCRAAIVAEHNFIEEFLLARQRPPQMIRRGQKPDNKPGNKKDPKPQPKKGSAKK